MSIEGSGYPLPEIDPRLLIRSWDAILLPGLVGGRGEFDYGQASASEEILSNEFAITHADAAKPVLVTCGIGDCIGLAAWEPDHRIGFLTHMPSGVDTEAVFQALASLGNGQSMKFIVEMAGGIADNNTDKRLMESLKVFLIEKNQHPNLSFAVNTDRAMVQTHSTWNLRGQELGIDSRTGEFIGQYNPFRNPFSRRAEDKPHQFSARAVN